MTKPVSVVIVAANSGQLLRACVERALAASVPVQLLVIDNASRDGVPQALDRAYADDARVRFVYNHANLGFGRAVNLGARVTHGERLLVLNPDCMLEPATLARLLAVLDAYPSAGVVGAVVCAADGTPDPASRRRDPLLARTLNQLTGRATRNAGDAQHEGVSVPGPIPPVTMEVENISGALMLFRRAAFEHLRGFDEGYFLHFEDLDLCRRMRDAGYQVLLAGDVRVQHAKGGSSHRRPLFVSYHKHQGMWRWFTRFDPAARKPLVRGLVALGIAVHFLLLVPALAWRRFRFRLHEDRT